MERNPSRLALVALYAGITLLCLTPLAPLLITQRLSQVVGGLEGNSQSGHPWIMVAPNYVPQFCLLMAILSGCSAVVALIARRSRETARWLTGLALVLSLLACFVWFAAWDHSLAWRELYRDLGVKE